MRKIILNAALLFSVQLMHAQWTTTGTHIYSSNTGSVGIGTTAPTTKLHVVGDFKVERNSGLQSNAFSIGFTSNPTSNIAVGGGSAIFKASNPNGTSDMLFMPTPTSHALIIKSDGKIGINALNPTAGLTVNNNVLIGDPATVSLPAGYKLYVETGILTEKVKVALKSTANWADFVFDKNYKLTSLTEVELYIKENKHLPGIPSADEVVESGLDLAEMDAKLLQKIEELWLHVIELKKENQLLKEQLTKKD